MWRATSIRNKVSHTAVRVIGPTAFATGAVVCLRRSIWHVNIRRGASKYVERAMKKRKKGTLKSGRSGKKVRSRKQAIAIGLSEARKEGKKVPRKKPDSKGRQASLTVSAPMSLPRASNTLATMALASRPALRIHRGRRILVDEDGPAAPCSGRAARGRAAPCSASDCRT